MSERLQDRQEDRGPVWPRRGITFPRVGGNPVRFGILTGVLTALVGLPGCAPTRPPVVQVRPAVVAPPSGPAYGTIAAVRPIDATSGSGSGADPRAEILAALGLSPAAGAGGAAIAEIIVQTDDGGTLSVVQAESAGLVPGARVMVLPGASGRRLVPAQPAG